ncbi:MAG TPA: LysE family transporter, partial [Chloroflexia bacterium]
MPDSAAFAVFLTAAVILALTPGPGIFYVLARSLQGGRRVGLASALGTALGGLVHVVAAALGLSAILATSALAFSVVKYA